MSVSVLASTHQLQPRACKSIKLKEKETWLLQFHVLGRNSDGKGLEIASMKT